MANDTTDENKINWKKNLIKAWRRTTPKQKLMLFIFIFFFISLITIAIESFTGGSEKKVISQESKAGSIAIKGKGSEKLSEDGIIERIDDETKAAQINQVERAKAIHEARQGSSAFQPLSVNDNTNELKRNTKKDNPRTAPPQLQVIERKPPVVVRNEPTPPPVNHTSRNHDVLDDVLISLNETKMTAGTNKKMSAGTANIHNHQELRKDPLAGLTQDVYLKELEKRTQEARKKIDAYIKQEQTQRTTINGKYQLIANTNVNAAEGENPQASNASANNGNGNSNSDKQKIRPMLMKPGEQIIAYNPYPVDSRLKKPFIMYIKGGVLDEGVVRCNYVDADKYLVPVCDEITYGEKVGKFEATALNPKDLSGFVDQDIDDDLFLKTLARIGANITATWGAKKLESGNKITENSDTNTTVQENTLSDKEILLGSLASTLGDFTGAAEAYYKSPAVRTIKEKTVMILTLTRPLPDWWGIKEKEVEDAIW